MRAELDRIGRRIVRLEARPRPPAGDGAERARFDWYADSCPCGRAAGTCADHPRARAGQRPPPGDWRTWLMLMGRGAGKTRAAAAWVRHRVESGAARRLALVGATAADVRAVMIEGPSGLLANSPPWSRPRYEPSKRRLTWPDGAIATAYSAERPDRLRGAEHDAAWCDELAAWRHPEALDHLLLGLRIGPDPRVCATTTPRRVPAVMRLLDDPATAISRGTTHDNRAHLSPGSFRRIVAPLEGTRLGRQELAGELLEVSEGAWFARFEPARHVGAEAEYDPDVPVHLAIDCGVSRHAAAVWFQIRGRDPIDSTVTVFGDWHGEGLYSEAAARAILGRSRELPCGGRVDAVRLDPASTVRSGIGPPAHGEFARVLGCRPLACWPSHRVADGLDRIEVLLDKCRLRIHPRCVQLIAAFRHYTRRRTPRGEWLDEPEDPQHPHEDLMDALRGGLCDRFPEGRFRAESFPRGRWGRSS